MTTIAPVTDASLSGWFGGVRGDKENAGAEARVAAAGAKLAVDIARYVEEAATAASPSARGSAKQKPAVPSAAIGGGVVSPPAALPPVFFGTALDPAASSSCTGADGGGPAVPPYPLSPSSTAAASAAVTSRSLHVAIDRGTGNGSAGGGGGGGSEGRALHPRTVAAAGRRVRVFRANGSGCGGEDFPGFLYAHRAPAVVPLRVPPSRPEGVTKPVVDRQEVHGFTGFVVDADEVSD